MGRMNKCLVMIHKRTFLAAILLMGVIAPAIFADWPQLQLTITADNSSAHVNGSVYVAVGGTLNITCALPSVTYWDPFMDPATQVLIDATWGADDLAYLKTIVDNSCFTDGNLTNVFNAPATAGPYTVTIATNLDIYYQRYDDDDDFADGSGSLVITVEDLVGINVTGATQTKVNSPDGLAWASVKSQPGSLVYLEAELTPVDNSQVANAVGVSWTNGIPGPSQKYQEVAADTAAHTHVTATVGTTTDYVDMWIIWVNLVCDTNPADTCNAKCITLFTPLVNNVPNWAAIYGLGGGNLLGPANYDPVGNPNLTYCYAIGKMQGTGTIAPAGAENVINSSAWGVTQNKSGKRWENGGHYDPTSGQWCAGPVYDILANAPEPDGPSLMACMLNPTTSGGLIFNVDAPGVPGYGGIIVHHNSEAYVNFVNYATVTLDSLQQCSDSVQWQYRAKVNVDAVAPNPIVLLNAPDSGNTAPPANTAYRGTLSISGNITLGGNALAGATVAAGGIPVLTDANGNYTINGIPPETHIVTPTMAGTSFQPATLSVILTNANSTANNFTATQP